MFSFALFIYQLIMNYLWSGYALEQVSGEQTNNALLFFTFLFFFFFKKKERTNQWSPSPFLLLYFTSGGEILQVKVNGA